MRRSTLALALSVVLLFPEVAFAHKHSHTAPAEGASPNKKWKVASDVHADSGEGYAFVLFEWDDAKAKFVKKVLTETRLRWDAIVASVADDGAFVLYAPYEGLAIFGRDGKLVKRLEPRDLLTKEELAAWSKVTSCEFAGDRCDRRHPWARFSLEIDADSKHARIVTYSDRAIVLVLGTGERTDADRFTRCARAAHEGTSANGKWRIAPALDGTFTLWSVDGPTNEPVKAEVGKFLVFGHHLESFVTDDGAHFAIFDRYEGLAIYTSVGKLVKMFSPKDLLAPDEVALRPGKWSSHPDGFYAGPFPSSIEDTARHSKDRVYVESWPSDGVSVFPDSVYVGPWTIETATGAKRKRK
ncbi:hypothetical protein HY251_12675 [bacterium]|nr:hypothetical protein [bacterium]